MGAAVSDTESKALLAATMAGALVTPIMSTMMNLALVHIGSDFGVGSHDLGYVNTAFLLGSVIGMVPFGRLSAIAGMRRTFIGGVVVLLAAVTFAMLSPNFWCLVAARAITGVGASAMTVTAMAMLTLAFPPGRRGWAIGMQTTAVYLGLSLGPTLGGVVSDALGWRALFAIPMALAAASLLMMRHLSVEFRPSEGQPMDWKGSAMWALAIVPMALGAMNADEPWGVPLLVVGTAILAATAVCLSRTEYPVLQTRLFRDRTFSLSSATAFMNYAASYSVAFFLALYLQSIGGMTASEAGLLMLIQPAVQVLLTARFGAMSDRMADKRVLPTAGMAVTAAGVGLFLIVGEACSLPLIVAIMLLIGLGIAMFSSPNTSVIMSRAAPEHRGEASAVIAVVRQTGMIASMSVAMAVIAAVMGSADNLAPETYGEFVDALHISFGICLAMCAAGAVASWCRGRPEKVNRA